MRFDYFYNNTTIGSVAKSREAIRILQTNILIYKNMQICLPETVTNSVRIAN
jgi:hypothetical protein